MSNYVLPTSKQYKVPHAGMTAFSAPILTCKTFLSTLGKASCRATVFGNASVCSLRSSTGRRIESSSHRSIVYARWRQKCDDWRS